MILVFYDLTVLMRIFKFKFEVSVHACVWHSDNHLIKEAWMDLEVHL